MHVLLAGLAVLAMLQSSPPIPLSAGEAADGWILLFDGTSTFGWTPDANSRWRVGGGALVAETADTTNVLRSSSMFSDFHLIFDCRVPDGGKAVVWFRRDPNTKPEQPGQALTLDCSKDWRTYEVEWKGADLSASSDGKKIFGSRSSASIAGRIVLESPKGSRAEFRNLRLKPLNLTPLFNGQDLSGWKAVNAPPPKKGGGPLGPLKNVLKSSPKVSVWSVSGGLIRVEKGAGRLESGEAYDDFVMQMTTRTLRGQPKAGVFLRADAGQLGSGYEVRINHAFKNNNRNQPSDYGTGGLNGIQPARRVLSSENQFFIETVIARGRHIAVWVNGFQVTDYEDTRPEGTAVRTAARTKAGPISLETFDDDAKIEVRSVLVASIPKAPSPAAEANPLAAKLGLPPPPGAPSPTANAPGAPAANAPAIPPAGGPPPAAGGGAPAPIPSQQPNQTQQAYIQDLMQKAIQAEADPERQKGITDLIVSLDPNNAAALQLRQNATQKIDQKKHVEEETRSKNDEASRHKQEGERIFHESIQNAESSLLGGKLDVARQQVEIARTIDPQHPELQRLDVIVRERIRERLIERITLGSIGGAGLVGALFLVLRKRGKKDPFLEIMDGPEKGRIYAFDKEMIAIGAVAQVGTTNNDIVIQDPDRQISRAHCEVHRRGNLFYIIDVKSANGTFLKGKRLAAGKPALLKKGAKVSLGNVCKLRLTFKRKPSEG